MEDYLPITKRRVPSNGFKKGKSGNPKGRPKGKQSISTYLKKYLTAKIKVTHPISGKDMKMPVAEILALKLISIAVKGQGDRLAIMDIINRLEGVLSSHITSEGQIEKSVNVYNIINNLKEGELLEYLKSNRSSSEANSSEGASEQISD